MAEKRLTRNIGTTNLARTARPQRTKDGYLTKEGYDQVLNSGKVIYTKRPGTKGLVEVRSKNRMPTASELVKRGAVEYDAAKAELELQIADLQRQRDELVTNVGGKPNSKESGEGKGAGKNSNPQTPNESK